MKLLTKPEFDFIAKAVGHGAERFHYSGYFEPWDQYRSAPEAFEACPVEMDLKVHSGRFYVNADVEYLLDPRKAQQTLWNTVRRFSEVFNSELYNRPGIRESNYLFIYVGRVSPEYHAFDPEDVWIFHDRTWEIYGQAVGGKYPISFPTEQD